ncbi:hypothetical protein AAF712_000755 [Marasmius tenuissimus]|uniref:4a-hydroxytetrahydrobiopterin dehydratase n=1 Tax=Marasmius tenuissimus TaxID=585030 RepID=A0ABR3ADP0_9AGAR
MLRTVINRQSQIPPPVNGWPTPWLEPPEVKEYLFPLLRDSQWRLNFVPKASLSVPTLCKTFNFKGGVSALAFMKDVVTIADTEDHHPAAIQFNESPQPHVYIGVRTHSGKISPALLEYFTERIRADPPSKLRRQGITMRDIRFALLVEERFKEQYLVEDKGISEAGEGVTEPVTTVEELLRHLLSQV